MGTLRLEVNAVPVPQSKLPKLRRQKEKNRPDRAFVVLDGQRIACGRWGSEEAGQRYDRLIAEWLAGGRRRPMAPSELVTVVVLVDRFWTWAEQHFKKANGTPTSKLSNFRSALRPLLHLYGDTPATALTVTELRTVRHQMIKAGLARPTINQYVGHIRYVFKWGASHKLIPASISNELATVESLTSHRSAAPEPEPVQPVSDEMVTATLPYLTPTVQAMVRLQRLTGMRPEDVCHMAAGDIDTSGDVWAYRPADHKNAWRNRARVIFLGPAAQEVLRAYMKTGEKMSVFSPRQSERERRQAMRERRATSHSCGNGPGDNRRPNPARGAADQWTTASYGRAILRACDQAFPPPVHLARQRVPGDGRKAERWETEGEWRARLQHEGLLRELERWRREHRWSPNQLRHTYGTEVRKLYDLETAQVLLGHAKADVTQIYAARDTARAQAVAREIG